MGRETSVRLENGTLLVDATTKQWALEVRRASSIILTRLQNFLGPGAVSAISVRERA
jgi:Dna[CI] antecedent, DciA